VAAIPVPVRAPLRALVLVALLAGPATAQATLIGSFVWSQAWTGFGGFSAIEITDDGAGFIALSDRSLLVSGQFIRDGDGITGVAVTDRQPLLDDAGRPLRGDRADSEGLALAPDGTLFISFEGVPRVRRQSGMTGTPILLPSHPDFALMQSNAALEALAIGPDGTLYTIPERSGRANRPYPVYRFADGEWTIAFTIPRIGPFLPSGADIGPDGMLYLLERDFVGIGFRSRVRRFGLDGSGGEVLVQTGLGTHGNLEGISVWADARGLRLTMIADDNFQFLQQTQIVEYRLD